MRYRKKLNKHEIEYTNEGDSGGETETLRITKLDYFTTPLIQFHHATIILNCTHTRAIAKKLLEWCDEMEEVTP